MRRAAKLDDNHRAIVEALERIGCLVVSLASVGGGCPDLLAWTPHRCTLVLLEIKDGNKAPSARRLTPQQREFHDRWATAAEWDQLVVVTSPEEAVEAVCR